MKSNSEIDKLFLKIMTEAFSMPEKDRANFIKSRSKFPDVLKSKALKILENHENELSHAASIKTGGGGQFLENLSVPENIGPYKLDKRIGIGGMGAVYLGNRSLGDFDHIVAIKVISTFVSDPELSVRLRLERSHLAKLKHSNIAQIYDGGELEDGRPYYIMEYVPGKTLIEFVEIENAKLGTLLELFLQVCGAVSWAHQHMIVHTDITPNNIIVTNEYEAKLIDFGLSAELTNDKHKFIKKKVNTGTKGYIAPELLDGEPVSTVADVYSLGAVLKFLISRKLLRRHSDLKSIIAKATQNSPELRYQQVTYLIDDIQSYLSQKPVQASNGGWGYKAKLFVLRNKAVSSLASVLAFGFLAAMVSITVLYFQAKSAQLDALKRYEEVRAFANWTISDLNEELQKIEGTVNARSMLVERSLEYLDSLSGSAKAPVDVKFEQALGYKELSDVVGNPNRSNLGDVEKYRDLLGRANLILDSIPHEYANTERALRARIQIASAVATNTGLVENDNKEAVSMMNNVQELSLQLLEKSFSLEDNLVDAYLNTAKGYMLVSLDRGEEAEDEFNSAIKKYEDLLIEFPENRKLNLRFALAHIYLGEAKSWHAYFRSLDYKASLDSFDYGINKLRELARNYKTDPELKNELINGLWKRAQTSCYLEGERQNGVRDLDEALATNKEMLTSSPYDIYVSDTRQTILSMKMLCLQQMGLHRDAMKVGSEVVEHNRIKFERYPNIPENIRNLASVLNVYAQASFKAGESEQTCEAAREIDGLWGKYISINNALLDAVNKQEFEQNLEMLKLCTEL